MEETGVIVFSPLPLRRGFSAVINRTEGNWMMSHQSGLESLSPALRVLLIADGTLSKMLEAFFCEPIDVEVLLHREVTHQPERTGWDLTEGAPMVERRVVLRGRSTSAPYLCAKAIIARDRIPAAIIDGLTMSRRGLGELILDARLETYRELISLQRTKAGRWADSLEIKMSDPISVRVYNIYHNTALSIQLTEAFAERFF